MAENGIIQMGYPRIGQCADRQRPEPVHDEINAWPHLLNAIYKEALRRELNEEFLEVLSLPLQVSDNDQARKPISTTQSTDPQGAGDRARQSELLQGNHKAF